MFGDLQTSNTQEPTAGEVTFHPMKVEEFRFPKAFGGNQFPPGFAVRPKYVDYTCGACGQSTNGRVLCDMVRQLDGTKIRWCLCSCEREEPTLLVEAEDGSTGQMPLAREFHSDPTWPSDLRELYDEAAKSYTAEAFTAAAMVCRKLLMVCACHEGDADGKTFTQYVDYIIDKVLTLEKAKATIDSIRSIGNDANHKVRFVAQADAKKAVEIATYLLRTVYSIPAP